MGDKVKAVPDGFHTLTPHLTVRGAARAIEFYQKAFGAEVLGINQGPEGKIMHAALKIPLGDAFWGDPYGAVVDPFGHTWSLASKVKDVSRDEVDKAGQDLLAGGMKKSA